jgi:hypothetical protein
VGYRSSPCSEAHRAAWVREVSPSLARMLETWVRAVRSVTQPSIGLNLQADPLADVAIETLFCIACWAYYGGTRKLLAALVVLNLLDLPLMLGGEGDASPMVANRYLLPTVIAVTIALAWFVTYRYARRETDHVSAFPGPATPSTFRGVAI